MFISYTILHILLFVTYNYGLPKVETKLGKVVGHLKTSLENRKFAAFEGIPYAKPPIGDLRFKESVPAEPWYGVLNATTLYHCIQKELKDDILGHEDCLYLNVYVPREQPSSKDNFEVIVHIHGGAFAFGSPSSYTLPNYLVDRDFVYVSMNYRLGPFGFLSTEDDVLPGNNGLKDQLLALKWIKDNIKSFGGNPNSITLTGFSAGGASTHFHFLSPLSRGLFHRGISHSGCSLNPWAFQEQPAKITKGLAELLGCPTSSSKMIVSCLTQRSAKSILSKIPELPSYTHTPMSFFAPVIEKTKNNQFLPNHPYIMLKNKQFNDMPWLFSVTTDEGLYPGFDLFDNFDKIDGDWNKVLPYLLEFYNTQDESLLDATSAKIKDYYFKKDGTLTVKHYKTFIQMLTHRLFNNELETAAKLQAKNSENPVYFYYYNFRSNTTLLDALDHNVPSQYKGICHGDDIIHIYGNVVPNAVLGEEDKAITTKFLDMLVSYAKNNIPKIDNINWKPTGFEELSYLNITSPSDIKFLTQTNISPVTFWKGLNLKENDNV